MAISDHSRVIDRFDPQVLSLLNSLDLKARYIVEGFLNGLHQSPFHGLSVEFSEYREYQPGDDLRHLDWHLYARSDRLCIKKYTQETNVRMYLVIDTSASMSYRGRNAWGSKLEVAQTVAAALASLMLRQNDAVGLLTMDEGATGAEFIRPSQKPSQFGLLLSRLQGMVPAGGPRLASLLDHVVQLIHRRSVVLFFSDLLEDAAGITESFRRLRFDGHECLIFQILDRDEIEFPFAESSVFSDLESGTRRTVDPGASREHYLTRFEAFMQEHRELFQTLEMPQCLIRTDREPWEALTLFLTQRKRLL